MRYETVPREVDAVQLTPETLGEIPVFAGSSRFELSIKEGLFNALLTVKGIKMLAVQGTGW